MRFPRVLFMASFSSHRKELITAAVVVVAGGIYVLLLPLLPLHLPCLFKSLTGVPCPGCGTVRSLQLLLRGDVVGSVQTNPLGLLLTLLAVAAVVLVIRDARRDDDLLYRLMHHRWPVWALVLVVLLTIANWCWNIAKGV